MTNHKIQSTAGTWDVEEILRSANLCSSNCRKSTIKESRLRLRLLPVLLSIQSQLTSLSFTTALRFTWPAKWPEERLGHYHCGASKHWVLWKPEPRGEVPESSPIVPQSSKALVTLVSGWTFQVGLAVPSGNRFVVWQLTGLYLWLCGFWLDFNLNPILICFVLVAVTNVSLSRAGASGIHYTPQTDNKHLLKDAFTIRKTLTWLWHALAVREQYVLLWGKPAWRVARGHSGKNLVRSWVPMEKWHGRRIWEKGAVGL